MYLHFCDHENVSTDNINISCFIFILIFGFIRVVEGVDFIIAELGKFN